MSDQTISEYVAAHGQTATAGRLGVGQSAVSQMLASQREIYVREVPDEADPSRVRIEAYEIKPVGRRRSA